MLKQLFVYGTLRQDLNEPTIDAGEPIGLGWIPGLMYDINGWYPGVVPPVEGEDTKVRGQVLTFESLDDAAWKKQLALFDTYEGVPYLYNRNEVEVTLDDGTLTDAFVYYFTNSNRADMYAPVPTGDWADV